MRSVFQYPVYHKPQFSSLMIFVYSLLTLIKKERASVKPIFLLSAAFRRRYRLKIGNIFLSARARCISTLNGFRRVPRRICVRFRCKISLEVRNKTFRRRAVSKIPYGITADVHRYNAYGKQARYQTLIAIGYLFQSVYRREPFAANCSL